MCVSLNVSEFSVCVGFCVHASDCVSCLWVSGCVAMCICLCACMYLGAWVLPKRTHGVQAFVLMLSDI